MNAWTPTAPNRGARRPIAPRDRPTAGAKPRPAPDPAPPPQRRRATPHRYRLRYTKLGRVAYLGHLDLMRHLPRIFRRAGFEIYLLGRVSPQARAVVRAGAGAGDPVAGRAPRREAGRRRSRPTSWCAGCSARHPGRASSSWRRRALGDNDRALGRVITEAEFAARLPAGTDVAAALARFAGEASRCRSLRDSTEGIGRTVDVRKSLRRVALFEDDGARARGSIGPTARWCAFASPSSHEGSARPSEVLAALFGADVAPRAELARLGCGRAAGAQRRRSRAPSIRSTSSACGAWRRPVAPPRHRRRVAPDPPRRDRDRRASPSASATSSPSTSSRCGSRPAR